jgi:prevent-host-death family protein
MEEIAISKFKATCLAVLDRVRKSGKPILVTRFGEPMAEVVPAPSRRRPKQWVGSLASTGKINGDIVSAAGDEEDWEALR